MEGRLQRCVFSSWFQQGDVEHGVDSGVLGEFESVVLRSLLFLNEKWSDFDLVQFLGGSSGFEVFCQKVHLIPLLKLRCHFSFVLEVVRCLGLCDSNLVTTCCMYVFELFGSDHRWVQLGIVVGFHEQVWVFAEICEERRCADGIGKAVVERELCHG